MSIQGCALIFVPLCPQIQWFRDVYAGQLQSHTKVPKTQRSLSPLYNMMTFVDAVLSCARDGVQWDRKVSYASVPGIRNQGGAVRAVMKNDLWQEHAGKPWRKDGLNGRRTGKSITVEMVTGAHPDSACFRKWEGKHLVRKCCLASVRDRV